LYYNQQYYEYISTCTVPPGTVGSYTYSYKKFPVLLYIVLHTTCMYTGMY